MDRKKSAEHLTNERIYEQFITQDIKDSLSFMKVLELLERTERKKAESLIKNISMPSVLLIDHSKVDAYKSDFLWATDTLHSE
jgi:hypothetical protein